MKPDNPPAFPVCMNGNQTVNPGMGLRDYFAGQAIGAIIAGAVQIVQQGGKAATPESMAKDAYSLADAFLAERAQTSDQPPAAP